MNKWDLAYLDTATRFAMLSTAKRLQVGAVAVKDNRIISIGYNGMPSGWDNQCEDADGKTRPEVVHAEANAIIKLARDGESGKDSTMYITHAPCVQCAKMIYGAGIKKVIYRDVYRDEWGVRFLKECGVEVEQAKL